MHAPDIRLRARSTLVGAALLGTGALAGGVIGVGVPEAGASPATPPATIAAGSPSSTGPACTAPTMGGTPQGDQASPVIHQGSDVLVGLPGYYPDRNAATTNGPSGRTGPRTGGLLPVGSSTGKGNISSTSNTTGSTTAGSGAATAPVMTGPIEGDQASPVIHQGSDVLVGLPGYYPDRNAATTNGPSGHTGPRTGGLLPVGSSTGTGNISSTSNTTGSTGASC